MPYQSPLRSVLRHAPFLPHEKLCNAVRFGGARVRGALILAPDITEPPYTTVPREAAMNLADHVICAIDDFEDGKLESALMHACVAVDATAKKLYSSERSVTRRFKKCIREYHWLIEPTLASGLNLDETKFSNVIIGEKKDPDFADIVYLVFRCNHAHGDEVPASFHLFPQDGSDHTRWLFGPGAVHLPDRLVWALLFVVVMSKVNKGGRPIPDYRLTLGGEEFMISDWWGREDEIRQLAERLNQVRVTMIWPHPAVRVM